MSKKAILLGASGLIGSYLLRLLLASDKFSSVTIFVRKPVDIKNEKLTEIITDFAHLDILRELITGDIIISCLGSTKNKTPDLKEYRRIDHDIPVEIANFAAQNGVQQFHLISSLGANPESSNFYSKMKGETEEDIKKTAIPTIHIYQPSLLRGDRMENRLFEKIALQITKVIDPLLIGSLKKYRSIEIEKVAQAMFNQSIKEQKGIFTYQSDQIKELA